MKFNKCLNITKIDLPDHGLIYAASCRDLFHRQIYHTYQLILASQFESNNFTVFEPALADWNTDEEWLKEWKSIKCNINVLTILARANMTIGSGTLQEILEIAERHIPILVLDRQELQLIQVSKVEYLDDWKDKRLCGKILPPKY